MKAHSRQCVTAVTPIEICSAYRCAVTQHKCSAALFRAKCNPHCSVLLCKTGLQQALCQCIYTYGDLLCIQVYSAASQGKMHPHCLVRLCKTGSQQAVCHCSDTYRDLLCIQVCSDPAQMQCSTFQGKMQSPLFSVALQNRLAAGTLSMHLHLWRFAVHTGVQ